MDSTLISILIPSFKGGGAEKMMINLANELSERGYNIHIVVNNIEGPYKSFVNPKIPIHKLHLNRYLALVKLGKYVKNHRPSIIISALFDCNILSILIKILSFGKLKVIISERNFRGEGNNISSIKIMIIEFLKEVFYRFSDRAIGISKGITNVLISDYGVRKNQAVTIHNPVFSRKIIDLSEEVVDDEWFLNPDMQVIVSVGRLVPVKDHITLLKSLLLINRNKNIKLVIIGEGPERQNIELFIKKNGLSSNVKLLGFVKNPYKYIRKSDLLVLTSLAEGFGNVLVEALALGVPIISTDCQTGPKDIIKNNEFGILVPVSNPNLLSVAIKSVLEGEIKYNKEKLQERARDFSIHNITDEYEQLINTLLNE